jgi:hypothetical protein
MGNYPAIKTIPDVTTSLTSIERVKEFLQKDEVDDRLMSNLIASVSAEIEADLGRTINQATVTDERIDSIGATKICTRHYPIISISSLTESGTALVADTGYEAKAADLAAGCILRISGGYPTSWASGAGVVKITYVHGYAAVPKGIVQAATELVAFDYRQSGEGGGRFGLGGKALDTGGTSVYLTRSDIWAAQEKRLAPHRRSWT